MVTPWGLPIVPIVWVSIVLDDPPTPVRTGLLLSMDVYPHISTHAINFGQLFQEIWKLGCVISILVSEPNPLQPLRDLQYGLGEMVFGGCRHFEYMNI